MGNRTAIAILCLIATRALAGSGAQVTNGGFEKGLRGWRFLNNSGNSKVDFDKRTKAGGKQALHWVKSGGAPMDVLRHDLGALPVGRKVTVAARFKLENSQNGWFKIFFYDGKGDTIEQGADVKPIRGTKGWHEIAIANKVPKGQKTAAIFILLVMPGEVWIDDVTVSGPGIGRQKGKAASKPELKPLDSRIRSYLDNRAIKVKTLDFDASLGDLSRLKGMLRGVRIVQLGENSHGDGECFRAKARLVRYLHEQMGFTVLAFESGLYECERANEQFEKGDVTRGIDGSVFGIWRTAQTRPMFEYLARSTKGKNPLRLSGFDTRGSGLLAREFLPRLQDFLASEGTLSTDGKLALQRLDAQLDGNPYQPAEDDRAAGIAALRHLRSILDRGRAALVGKHGEREVDFQSRCLDNYVVRENFEFSKNEPGKMGEHGRVNLRDAQMASNLRWLVEKRYPEEKIITWGATFHLAHGLEAVSIGGDKDYYAKTRSMGEFVHEWWGEKVFTIGFVAYEGEGGILSPRFTIPEPEEGSFEELMFRYGKDFVIVPLNRRNPFEKPMLAAPMAYGRGTSGPWPKVLDALFYIREMSASRPMER